MKKTSVLLAASALFALSACDASPEDKETATEAAADDFAARIQASGPQIEATVAPTVEEPRENAAQGAYAPGTATDPDSATCGANRMRPFIGFAADDATRAAIVAEIAGANEVRFVMPGATYVRPDPSNPRLNIMLDAANIIRDARCG